MAAPEQSHIPTFTFDDPLSSQVLGSNVRGMDHYQLYGFRPECENIGRRRPSRVMPKVKETSFAFHEITTPIISAPGAPEPTSNSPALDALVAHRIDIPLWERGYRLTGRIMIDAKSQRFTVNGRNFRPAAREREVPYHSRKQHRRDWARVRFGRVKSIDTAIWVNHPTAHTYFHVFNDVVSQLVLAEKLGIDPNIPVIVDEVFAHSDAGKYFLKTPFFNTRKIVVMAADDVLRCRCLYMLQPQYFSSTYLAKIAAAVLEEKPAQPVGDRLVLVREKGALTHRPCEGIDALTNALVAKGYTALDPATLTIPEQKWVFSRAKHIVAENGSALTNILFRAGQELRIDTLVASTFPSVTFQCLSKVYGFCYHAHVLPSQRHGDQFHSQLTASVMNDILSNAMPS
jgi:hypothetical protein